MKSNKGLTLIESLVCLVIIGIGFIAVNQLITFAVSSMERSIERTKVNFLSEMVIEDMMGDVNNASSYVFNEQCTHSAGGASNLSDKQKNKWREKFQAKNQIRILQNNVWKEKKPRCLPGDGKRSYVDATTGRFIFKTNKGKRKKYLGVGLK
tara:strand:+ start:211 stop:666 length:456 start_codon:yes stop_codon:yes gene_type:complete